MEPVLQIPFTFIMEYWFPIIKTFPAALPQVDYLTELRR